MRATESLRKALELRPAYPEALNNLGVLFVRTEMYAEAEDEFKLGIREGDWKYIFDLRSGTDELYNLAADPDEQHRVTGEDARAARLRQRLAAWAEANRRHYTKPDAR